MKRALATHLHRESTMYRVCITLVDATRARLLTFRN